MDEAQALLARDGFPIDTLRIRAFPLAREVAEFVRDHDEVFVVEQNRDAQMRTLLTARSRDRAGATHPGPPFQQNADHRPFRCPGGRQSIAASDLGANVGARFVTYLGKPKFPPVNSRQRARLHTPRLRRFDVDAVRRLWARRD
jgi:hypothetical protein